jgi:hypothetical protein
MTDYTIPEDLSVPQFLRIPPDVRRQAWNGRKLTTWSVAPQIDWSLPQSLTDAERERVLAERAEKEAARKAKSIEALERMKNAHEGQVYVPAKKDRDGAILAPGFWKFKEA